MGILAKNGRPKKRLVERIKTKAWFKACLKNSGLTSSRAIAMKTGVEPRLCQMYAKGERVPQLNLNVQSVSKCCNKPLLAIEVWKVGILGVPLWSSFECKVDIVKWLQDELNVSPAFFFTEQVNTSVYIVKLIHFTQTMVEQPNFSLDRSVNLDDVLVFQNKMKIARLSLSVFYLMVHPDAMYFFDESITLKQLKMQRIRLFKKALRDCSDLLLDYKISAKEFSNSICEGMEKRNKIELN